MLSGDEWGIGSSLVSNVSLQKMREWAARIDPNKMPQQDARGPLPLHRRCLPEGRDGGGVYNERVRVRGPVRRGG